MFEYTQKDLDRFYAKVEYDDEGCWEWTSTVRGGYGLFSLNGKPVSAHRFALFLEIGEYEGSALHTCDNPPCVRGSHLFAGTHQDNMDDMYAKGRRGRRKPYKKKDGPRKVRKLSEDDVREIVEKLESPYWGQVKDLAKQYGVTHARISHIKRVSSKK
jgi:hypothetical protein